MVDRQEVLAALARHLEPLGFVRFDGPVEGPGTQILAVWRRRTWNTNRAVAVLTVPSGRHPGTFIKDGRLRLGKQIGYLTFLYGLGLQAVLLDSDLDTDVDDLDRYVDKVDNQQCIVQSIHLVDEARGRRQSVRTWGQVITGKFIDAIEAALDEAGLVGGPR